MESVKVALLQLLPTGSISGNLQKGLDACRQAKALGADIALFPEMWSIGYDIYDRPAEQWLEDAIPSDGTFVQQFSIQAKQLDMAICITFLEQYIPAPRNTLLLFDRHGKNVLTYAKVHTCDFSTERNLTPGDKFQTVELDTAAGIVKVGAMICYDREFPESARILMLQGAELILVPNACPMEINRISQLRSRAYENMLGIATCNYPTGHPDCNGHSTAFDGIAYKPELSSSRDTLLVDAGEKECICIADFPLHEIRDYRSREVHGNAYRRPSLYHPLTEAIQQVPFLRKDYRG